jgi:hypothetical protein
MTDRKEKDEVRQTLALQEALKQEMDGIVHAATKTVLLLKGSEMKNSQLRNVLNVAEESDSVAVTTNFIRYQIGRAGTGKAWQHNGFGLCIIEDITAKDNPLYKVVEAVTAQVKEQVGEEAVTADLRRRAQVEMMRYYLGYLNRAFSFGSSSKDETNWKLLEQAVKEEQHV